ncbi:MAG: MFS transporter [Ilumatobacteraceae bacterium]
MTASDPTPVGDAPPRRSGALAALKHREFAYFFTAAAISNAGGWMQMVAVPALLFDLTDSSTWLGVASVAALIPAVFLTPHAGVLADRVSRRTILLFTQLVQMTTAFVLWITYSSGDISPWLIVGLGLVGGVATGFQTAAWQSFVPLLVPSDLMLEAVRLNSVQFTLARAIGPGLAGLVISTLGTGAAIFINASTYLLVIAALTVTRPRQTIVHHGDRKVSEILREGGRYVWRNLPLRIAVILAFVGSLCGQSLQYVTPAIANRIFDRPSTDNAGLLVALGLGAVTSSVLSVAIGDRIRRSTFVLVSLFLFAGNAALVALTSWYWLGITAYFIGGLGHLQMAVALNTLIQGAVPDHVRGRTMSFYVLGILGGIPIGAFVLGRLGDVVSMRFAVAADAVALGVVIVALVSRGWLRQLDTTRIEE